MYRASASNVLFQTMLVRVRVQASRVWRGKGKAPNSAEAADTAAGVRRIRLRADGFSIVSAAHVHKRLLMLA